MSLLDDVSIVVTPNGYKAGELYAVVPVPTEGSEEITDGNFPLPNTNWILGGSGSNIPTIGTNDVAINSVDGNSFIQQSGILTSGKYYKITYDVISASATSNVLKLASSFGLGSIPTSVGTQIVYGTAISSTFYIERYTNGVNATITNVTVKEYTSADMDVTRATAATRVDENGLVNYAEIVGGEEVTNGDFANGETGWSFGTNWEVVSEQATTTGVTLTPISQSVLVNGTNRLTFDVISGGAFVYTNYPSFSKKGDFLTLGTHTIDLESDGVGTNQLLYIYNNGAGNSLTLDNVSVKEVTRDNVPRIDYTGGGCPHILAEPQRTNTVTESEVFTDWSSAGTITLTTGQLAPDGTYNATKVSGVLNSTSLYRNESSTTASRSIYARTVSGTGTVNLMSYGGNTNNNFTITEEWQRFELTGSSATGGTNFYAVDFRFPSSNPLTELIIWGCQSEEGSYPTSMIPTSGGQVTRNQDIFTRDGIGSLINSTEGVLFLEVAALVDEAVNRQISISDNSTNNVIAFSYSGATNNINATIKIGGVVNRSFDYVLSDVTQESKIAIRYSNTEFSFWVDGTETSVNTLASSFSEGTLNRLALDSGAGFQDFFGKVKQLQVFKTALTDSELATLTTI